MRTVVKIGGSVLEDAAALTHLAGSLAHLPQQTVVVHGGGPAISRWQERLGLTVSFLGGLRVTTPESVELTSMALSGWVNKRVVAALVSAGRTAVGLSGEDGGLIEAEWLDRESLGEVGRVAGVETAPLEALLAAGLTPVVSPMSRGPDGVPLNVNADEAAIALTLALKAERLLLVSDVAGVVVGGEARVSLAADELDGFLADGTISGGMAVKMKQARTAAESGVEVRVGGPEVLTDPGAGTRVRAHADRGAAA